MNTLQNCFVKETPFFLSFLRNVPWQLHVCLGGMSCGFSIEGLELQSIFLFVLVWSPDLWHLPKDASGSTPGSCLCSAAGAYKNWGCSQLFLVTVKHLIFQIFAGSGSVGKWSSECTSKNPSSGVLCSIVPNDSCALDMSYWIMSYLPPRYLALDCWFPRGCEDLLSGENLGKQWDATQTFGIPRNGLEERNCKVTVVRRFSNEGEVHIDITVTRWLLCWFFRGRN